MNKELKAARAIRVRNLQNDDDIKQAFEDVKAHFIDEWTRTHDAAERENLWRAVHIVGKVQEVLASYAMASHPMADLKRTR